METLNIFLSNAILIVNVTDFFLLFCFFIASGMALLSWTRKNIKKIKYIQGENKACYEANDPPFRQVTCLDLEDQFYEVELAKT